MLDELDRRILSALLESPRSSFREIAKIAGTTAPTAIARIKRLEDIGAILGFQANIAPWALEVPRIPVLATYAAPVCHFCHGALPPKPVEQKIAGRHHLFCCETCKDKMIEKADRLTR